MPVQKDPEQNETRHLRDFGDLRGRTVLEIGVGEGRLTWRYAGDARRITGIDLDRDGLRVARIDRPRDLEKKVSLAEADASRLPFQAAAFEAAILAWSF